MTSLFSQTHMTEQEEELQSLRMQLQTLKERYQALQKSAVHDTDQMHQRKARELVIENEKLKSIIDKLSGVIQERDKKILDLQSAGNDLGTMIEETQQNLQQTQEALRQQLEEQELLEATWKSERGALVQERDHLLSNQEKLTQNSRERIQELESLYNELEERLQQQATEKQHAQEDAARAKMAQDDAEGRLKFAHYHLAKKVKETTDLTDRIQAMDIQCREYESNIKHLSEQSSELRKQLDEYQHQEKLLREQMHESVRSAELMVQGWEEKYTLLQRRWEDDEVRIKELSRVADRYHQMHNLWNNLNEFFCDVSGGAKEVLPKQEAQIATPEIPNQQVLRPYQNLFEPPATRYMANPFDRE